MASDRIERALRKRDRAALANLFFLRTEARFFLETLPAWAVFSAVYILFPDPWPKVRHNKHRILQSDFLSALAEHSGADAHVYFRTDFQPYYEAAARVSTRTPIGNSATTLGPLNWRPFFRPGRP